VLADSTSLHPFFFAGGRVVSARPHEHNLPGNGSRKIREAAGTAPLGDTPWVQIEPGSLDLSRRARQLGSVGRVVG
jgi:hypothetical protein